MKLVETNRLIVRTVESGDFVFLHSLYTTRENMQFISSGKSNWEIEEIKEKYAKNNIHNIDGYGLYIVELKEDKKVIGEAGIFNSFNNPSIMELGYIVDSHYWGKGYGTELCTGLITYCFEKLQTNKVVARMYADNTGSVQVSEKSGMNKAEEGLTPDGRLFYRYEILSTTTDE